MKSFVARSRWAAFGAAVAVSLGGGAVFVASAGLIPDNTGDVFVPVEPCRLLDTREDSPVNDGDGRIGPTADLDEPQLGTNDITVRFDSSATEMGACDLAIEESDDPVAIVMNVTVLNASAGSFVTIYPWKAMSGNYITDESARPFISQLNPWPAHPPITNTVTVGLVKEDGTGPRALRVYNHVGRVHVILDVVGYYTN